MAAASWKEALIRSLERNAAVAYSRYMQLATARPDGRPANRTVVFRGFYEKTSTKLMFVTDTRSQKVDEIKQCPHGEVCWYFPISREQYRLSGDLEVVGPDCEDERKFQARQRAWQDMSDSGRQQFSWPCPRQRRHDGECATSGGATQATEDEVLPTFALGVMDVKNVDYLQLKTNQRQLFKLADGPNVVWLMEDVNP